MSCRWTFRGLPADSPELRIAALLDQYRALREERLAEESRRTQSASGLLITRLQQRLFSSIEAFATNAARSIARLSRGSGNNRPANRQPRTASLDLLPDSVGADDERATLSEEAVAAEADAQMEEATTRPSDRPRINPSRALFDREQQLLDEMTELADTARFQPDAPRKEAQRSGFAPAQLKDGKHWTDLRVIIFTEYDDTKRYLINQLNAIIAELRPRGRAHRRLSRPDSGRRSARSSRGRLMLTRRQHPLRILIATDAAREGLNLQAHCWNLFHFDVPWNPGRMEQRNGRIDRKLQPNADVYLPLLLLHPAA